MYFEIKRRRFRQFKIDEMIDFNHGGKPNYVEKVKHNTVRSNID